MYVQAKDTELEKRTPKITLCNAGKTALDKSGSNARRSSVVYSDGLVEKSINLITRIFAGRTCDKKRGVQYLLCVQNSMEVMLGLSFLPNASGRGSQRKVRH